MGLLRNLKIRTKLLAVVLPLVVIPVFFVGPIVGYVSQQHAYQGITQTSKADLEHMTQFTLDLLHAHYQQFQVYKEDKRKTVNQELATLVNLAYNLADTQHRESQDQPQYLASAQQEARQALRNVNIGESGYLYVMNSKGDLLVHVAREGDNIYDAQDETGRYFIREMCEKALTSTPGQILYIIYPWRNEALGDLYPRQKVVAYRYFQPWDWIIAAGGYLDETYEDLAFERQAFQELKSKILSKKVAETGYIYAINLAGELTLHPFREGQNVLDAQDDSGDQFIREMLKQRDGWIRYPWKNEGDPLPRMKIVRYSYFEPWNWVVAVGSYEDEFYRPASQIEAHILYSMTVLTLVVGLAAAGLVLLAAQVLTEPIQKLIAGIREVGRGRLDTRLAVESSDELGELAAGFNRMTEVLRQNKELEATLAQQGKMASLGVLSSGVAHEINNPLGVILGYAAYLETKLDPNDPNFKYIQDIKRESKRCKTIVQDLLSYARVPKPVLEDTDLNALLGQIADFAAHHTDLDHVTVEKHFVDGLPSIPLDPDQIRQVALNLLLNAGAATADGGHLRISTAPADESQVQFTVQDTGTGIAPDNLTKVFEPFFTTKSRGTGLGLAITKTIVEQHRGKIEIASELGKGTTITVTLPTRRGDY
jgi:two-component system NtrC family sensor kinase